MSDSNAEKNKALVLEAFDTLFNKRDYAAAEQVLVTAIHPTQRSYRAGSRRLVRSHQKPSANAEVRAGNDRGGRQIS